MRHKQIEMKIIKLLKMSSQCNENWDKMSGDERVRLCEQCDCKVHNLSELDRAEASNLLASRSDDRPCISFIADETGNPIFKDSKQWKNWVAAGIIGVAGLTNGCTSEVAEVSEPPFAHVETSLAASRKDNVSQEDFEQFLSNDSFESDSSSAIENRKIKFGFNGPISFPVDRFVGREWVVVYENGVEVVQ